VNGVSTRKMERLAKSLGIENLSRSQVSNMAKEMDGQEKRSVTGRLRTTATRCFGWMLCMKRYVMTGEL